MTNDEKRRAYRKIAQDLIDYIYLCADRHIVPLMHDANVYNARFTAVDKAKVTR